MTQCHPNDSVEHDGLSCMVCLDCGREEPLRFRCLAYRCEWVESHHRLTGHDRYLLGRVPYDGNVTNVAWNPGKIEVPAGHVVVMVIRHGGGDSMHCSCGIVLRLTSLSGWPDSINDSLRRVHRATEITGKVEPWTNLARVSRPWDIHD